MLACGSEAKQTNNKNKSKKPQFSEISRHTTLDAEEDNLQLPGTLTTAPLSHLSQFSVLTGKP